MARHEARDWQVRATAIPYNPVSLRAVAAPIPAISVREVIGLLRAALLALLLVGWVAGAYAGIVYWSLQGSLLGVLASSIIPGIAATSTWWAFRTLERGTER